MNISSVRIDLAGPRWDEDEPPPPPAPPAPTYFCGLDLGQAQDFSALAVARKVPGEPARYELVGLRRWRLGEPYPKVVADVKAILGRPPLADPRATLALDFTGCGRPVGDMFELAGMSPQLVGIHAGFAVTQAGPREWGVPKRDLASIVAVLLQEERLKWPASLPEAPTLATELQNFRVKVSAAGNDTYGACGAWREGQHDDLVLAVALACWAGENLVPPVWEFYA
jgi:hypothetical protein